MSKKRKKITRTAIQCRPFSSFSDPDYGFDDPSDIRAIQETLKVRDPERRRGAGRETSLTPLKEHIILKAIKMGLSVQRAAGLAGLSLGTLYRWKMAAQDDAVMGKDSTTKSKYVEFREKFKRASIHGELEKLKLVNEAAAGGTPVKEIKTTIRVSPKTGKEIIVSKETRMTTSKPSWQAAMTLLERRYPERWGRIKQMEEEDVNSVSDKIKTEVLRMLNLVPSKPEGEK